MGDPSEPARTCTGPSGRVTLLDERKNDAIMTSCFINPTTLLHDVIGCQTQPSVARRRQDERWNKQASERTYSAGLEHRVDSGHQAESHVV